MFNIPKDVCILSGDKQGLITEASSAGTANAIDASKVVSVYAGKPNRCCCGCSGKHSYASKHRALGAKRRGYTVTDEDVSDRSVATIVRKINTLHASGLPLEASSFGGEVSFSIETETRLYVAYMA